MYDSSWEETSRSSHPNLWVPPVITTMSRSVYSDPEHEPEKDSPSHESGEDHRQHRLPSVDEILSKISHQERYQERNERNQERYQEINQERAHPHPLSQDVQYVHAPLGYAVPVQEHIPGHWQQLHPNQFVYDHRATEPNIVLHHHQHQHQHLGHYPPTHPGVSVSLSSEPQHHNIPSMAAKKRGRKKKSDTICAHCQSTQTPEWRRGPDGSRTLCNACGLFYSKLTKKFGFEDANMIFAFKKRHNEVQDRIVPTVQQKNRYENEMKSTAT